MKVKKDILAEYGLYVFTFIFLVGGIVDYVNLLRIEGFLLTDIVFISVTLIISLWWWWVSSKWESGMPNEKMFRSLQERIMLYIGFSLFMIWNLFEVILGFVILDSSLSMYSRTARMLKASSDLTLSFR